MLMLLATEDIPSKSGYRQWGQATAGSGYAMLTLPAIGSRGTIVDLPARESRTFGR